MSALAGSVLVSMVFAGVATVMSTSAPRPNQDVPNLFKESTAVEPRTTPGELERRFGRDTLLYFPMNQGTSALVALQHLVSPR